MSLTMKADVNGISYDSFSLCSKVLNYLLQGYTVVLDSDFLSEGHLEVLFENIRDTLLQRIQQGIINQSQFEKALANLITKSSLENLPPITPMVNVKMQMLAFIEEC